MEMRKALVEELEKLMRENEKICFLDADLSAAGGTKKLHETFPDRAINIGIAESNMIGVAAGLSASGFIPFTSSFAPFITRRVCDQIAVSVAYAKQNVKIIGLDPGISAELNGGTHMSFEDIGVLRSIPGMVIFEPVDVAQLRLALPQIVKYYGPVYIRLFRKETPDVFTMPDYKFDLFKADKLRSGKDLSIFVSGLSTADCLKAADSLSKENISAELINFHTIKPVDEQAIIESARKTKAVLTVENHNVTGGLFSAVSEVLARNCPTLCASVGVHDRFGQVGKLDALKAAYGMTENDIVSKARELLKKKN